MCKINIFLDDVRPTPLEFSERAFTVNECIDLLRKHKGNVNVLSLDNDLGENALEGRYVTIFLEEEHISSNFPLPKMIRVHSANPVAKSHMELVIRKWYSLRLCLSHEGKLVFPYYAWVLNDS